MESILKDIMKKNKISLEFSQREENFLAEEMQQFFKETLYYIEKENLYIYLLDNFMNKPYSVVIPEFYKAIIKAKNSLNTKKIKFYLVQNNEIKEFNDVLATLPISLDKYSPDFDYILADFEECSDIELKKTIKIKIYSEIIKYILKDPDLKDLTEIILNQ